MVSFTVINLQFYDNGKRRYLLKRSVSFLMRHAQDSSLVQHKGIALLCNSMKYRIYYNSVFAK